MAMATAMLVITLLMVLGVAYLGVVERDLHFATAQSHATQAYFLALYGLERYKLHPVDGEFAYGPGTVAVKAYGGSSTVASGGSRSEPIARIAVPGASAITSDAATSRFYEDLGFTWVGDDWYVQQDMLVSDPQTGGVTIAPGTSTGGTSSSNGIVVSIGKVVDARLDRVLATRTVAGPREAPVASATTDPGAAPTTSATGGSTSTGSGGGPARVIVR